MAVSILRLLEYTYEDEEQMTDDIARWSMPAIGIRKVNKDSMIRSSVMLPKYIGELSYTMMMGALINAIERVIEGSNEPRTGWEFRNELRAVIAKVLNGEESLFNDD